MIGTLQHLRGFYFISQASLNVDKTPIIDMSQMNLKYLSSFVLVITCLAKRSFCHSIIILRRFFGKLVVVVIHFVREATVLWTYHFRSVLLRAVPLLSTVVGPMGVRLGVGGDFSYRPMFLTLTRGSALLYDVYQGAEIRSGAVVDVW